MDNEKNLFCYIYKEEKRKKEKRKKMPHHHEEKHDNHTMSLSTIVVILLVIIIFVCIVMKIERKECVCPVQKTNPIKTKAGYGIMNQNGSIKPIKPNGTNLISSLKQNGQVTPNAQCVSQTTSCLEACANIANPYTQPKEYTSCANTCKTYGGCVAQTGCPAAALLFGPDPTKVSPEEYAGYVMEQVPICTTPTANGSLNCEAMTKNCTTMCTAIPNAGDPKDLNSNFQKCYSFCDPNGTRTCPALTACLASSLMNGPDPNKITAGRMTAADYVNYLMTQEQICLGYQS